MVMKIQNKYKILFKNLSQQTQTIMLILRNIFEMSDSKVATMVKPVTTNNHNVDTLISSK